MLAHWLGLSKEKWTSKYFFVDNTVSAHLQTQLTMCSYHSHKPSLIELDDGVVDDSTPPETSCLDSSFF